MRVVVVDPSRTVLEAVSRMLAHGGHDVSTFTDAPDALAFIRSNQNVSALISSAELPTMSGAELCWEAALRHDRAIYIILMSSNSDQRHLINALDSGADEFIGKPPAEEELYARLRSAERLVRMQRELIRLAKVDPLTSLFNRRAFFDKAQQAIAGECSQSPNHDHVRRGPFQADQRPARSRAGSNCRPRSRCQRPPMCSTTSPRSARSSAGCRAPAGSCLANSPRRSRFSQSSRTRRPT